MVVLWFVLRTQSEMALWRVQSFSLRTSQYLLCHVSLGSAKQRELPLDVDNGVVGHGLCAAYDCQGSNLWDSERVSLRGSWQMVKVQGIFSLR